MKRTGGEQILTEQILMPFSHQAFPFQRKREKSRHAKQTFAGSLPII